MFTLGLGDVGHRDLEGFDQKTSDITPKTINKNKAKQQKCKNIRTYKPISQKNENHINTKDKNKQQCQKN